MTHNLSYSRTVSDVGSGCSCMELLSQDLTEDYTKNCYVRDHCHRAGPPDLPRLVCR